MERVPEDCRKLTEAIIGAAIEVHRNLGPGLLESCYCACLSYELAQRGIKFQTEVSLPVRYGTVNLDCGYRMDMVIENTVLLELKACDEVTSVHEAQLLTYLKLSGFRVGLLINFNVQMLRDGITRRVL